MIFLAFVVILLAVTRNIPLAVAAGLVALPFIAWLGMSSSKMVIWSLALSLVMTLKYYPTAHRA